MPIKCQIWWDIPTGSYVISSPYNQKLVEGLKALIPSGDREFDPTTKFWYLKEQYGEALKMLSENMFGVGNVSFVSKTASEQSQKAQQAYIPPAMSATLGSNERAMINFIRLIPYDAAKKAYLIAASSLHPDKGGDPSKMSELNSVWTQIEKEVYRR